MKKILVKDLKEGLMFSEPVYIDGDNLLVPEGVEIRAKDISRLKTWGIEFVETNGKTVTPPNVISLPDVYENAESYRNYVKLIDDMDRICTNIIAGIPVETIVINEISSRLLRVLREHRDSFIVFILGGEVKGREMAKSLVNTAILSALTAMEIRMPNHRVLHIVTGSLLHDAGMLRLPKALVDKKGGLSEAELKRIQSHTLHAYKIAIKEMHLPPEVGNIVLQHHERWDGEGYPRGISGKTIDLGARIVSVVDAFEAMVSQKPYRNPLMGYQAMKNLMSDNLRRFDPDVIKVFIATMDIYPIGSIILLNNGAYARVIEIQAKAPLRPKIKILIDQAAKAYTQDDGEVIDLMGERSLFISRAVDPKEVADKEASIRNG